MKASSKLKQILHRYYCEFSLTEKGEFRIYLTDMEDTGAEINDFIAPNFSSAVAKAYSYYLKQKKTDS